MDTLFSLAYQRSLNHQNRMAKDGTFGFKFIYKLESVVSGSRKALTLFKRSRWIWLSLQGDKNIGKRLLALAQGWGGKSQVRLVPFLLSSHFLPSSTFPLPPPSTGSGHQRLPERRRRLAALPRRRRASGLGGATLHPLGLPYLPQRG